MFAILFSRFYRSNTEDKRAQNIDIHLISWGAFLIGFCVLNITILSNKMYL